MYCFGVDIGGTTVKMGLFEGDGNVIDKWEIKTVTANGGEAVLPDIAASIAEKLVEHSVAKEDVVGVGVGVPAPVSDEGVVKQTANLGWGYKEVRRELEELTGFKVKVGNDANVAALGEMWKGGGPLTIVGALPVSFFTASLVRCISLLITSLFADVRILWLYVWFAISQPRDASRLIQSA